MKKIYIIRHTTPKIAKGICYGQTDLALADTFEQELASIKAVVPEANTIPLWSSPLQRCYKLARGLNASQITVDERLKEMNFGDWEMCKWEDIPERELMPWMGNFVNIPAPRGESYLDVYGRAVQFWEELVQSPQSCVGVVTHYGIMQSLLAYLLHIPFEKAFRVQLDYGNVFAVTLNQDLVKVKFLK